MTKGSSAHVERANLFGLCRALGTENVDRNGDGFYWQASQDRISGNFAADNGVSGSWGTSGFGDLALHVSGAPVPEPASIAAIGLGIAGIRGRRSKRN
jgi:hypothetical protein